MNFVLPSNAADYTLSLANFKGPFCRDYHASSASTKPPGRAGSHRGRALGERPAGCRIFAFVSEKHSRKFVLS
jgi:hypothetical protein